MNDTSIMEYNARVDKYGKNRLIPILSVNVQTYQIYYSKTCLYRTLNKLKSCINQTLKKVSMYENVVNLTCINRTPVYSEPQKWSQRGSV